MKRLAVALAVLVLAAAAGAAEESPEAGKNRVDAQFQEGGGKAPPKDSSAVFAGEGVKGRAALSRAQGAKANKDISVPEPGKTKEQPSRWARASGAAGKCITNNAVPVGATGAGLGAALGLVVGAGFVPPLATTVPPAAIAAIGVSVSLGAAAGAAAAAGGLAAVCAVYHYGGAAIGD